MATPRRCGAWPTSSSGSQFSVGLTSAGLVSRLGAFSNLAADQLGPLALLAVPALVITAIRHPRYALYSGVAALVTCVFAGMYENARIDRYYLGPVFFAWSWLAAAGAAIVDQVTGASDDEVGDLPRIPGANRTRAGIAIALGIVLLVPTAIGLRDRWNMQDLSHATADPSGSIRPSRPSTRTPSSCRGGATPRRCGTGPSSRAVARTSPIIDDRTRLDERLGDVADVIEANLDTRPVYLIRLTDAEVQDLRSRYRIESVGMPGNLFRVTGRTETPAP
jgi:hypothetical protein